MDGHESNIFDIPEIRNAISSSNQLDKETMQDILNNVAKGMVGTIPITNIGMITLIFLFFNTLTAIFTSS